MKKYTYKEIIDIINFKIDENVKIGINKNILELYSIHNEALINLKKYFKKLEKLNYD